MTIPVRMTDEERAFFEDALGRHGRNYCEFGMGGSTLVAARTADYVVAVDSDERWVRDVGERPELVALVSKGRARLLHADIGPVGGWGYPTGEERLRHWPDYVAAPWAAWRDLGRDPTLVLVDGRFRVACAMSAAVAAPAAMLMIHDYETARPSYMKALDAFELVDVVGTLALFRRRDDVAVGAALARMLASLFETG